MMRFYRCTTRNSIIDSMYNDFIIYDYGKINSNYCSGIFEPTFLSLHRPRIKRKLRTIHFGPLKLIVLWALMNVFENP